MTLDLRHCDAREGLASLKDHSIDLCFTDPPYPKDFLWTYDLLAEELPRVLKEGGHAFIYMGSMYLPRITQRLSSTLTWRTIMALERTACPRVWVTRLLDGARMVQVYTNGIMGHDAPFIYTFWGKDVKSKEFHVWGQPIQFPLHIIDRFTQEGDTVLDPFLGGGTTAHACKLLNRNCIGFEIDPEAHKTTMQRVSQPLLDDWR